MSDPIKATLCVMSVVMLCVGSVIFAIGVTREPESERYTEGICTLTYTSPGVCEYNINYEINWHRMSCDVVLPRMNLTQYRTPVYPCYYLTSTVDGYVLFEKPDQDRNWGMVSIGIAMIVLAMGGMTYITCA